MVEGLLSVVRPVELLVLVVVHHDDFLERRNRNLLHHLLLDRSILLTLEQTEEHDQALMLKAG